MNKLLIVLLAVCLVSVHAFVKRDAPAETEVKSQIDAMTTKLGEIGTNIKDGAAKALDPDTIKKNFNEFVDAASRTVANFRSAAAGEAPKSQ